MQCCKIKKNCAKIYMMKIEILKLENISHYIIYIYKLGEM